MRSSLRTNGLCLALFCFLSTQTAAARELRISHQFHPENDSRGRAAQVFAAEVTRQAPELKISIHPQLSVGLTRDGQLDALQSGNLDFAVLPSIVLSKRVQEFSLALLPGLVPTLATARALKGSQIHARLQDIAAAHELRIVTWWWMRGGFATTKVGAISPASVSGLKFQSCGLMQDLLSDAGAQRGDDPASEIPMLLDMDALDGVAVPYEEFVALGLHEHTKLATFGGPALVMCFSPVLMSKKTWDALTPKQQRAVEQAAAASDAFFENAQVEVEQRALAAFQRAGAAVRRLTDSEYASWSQLARETVWARYAGASPVSRDLVKAAISRTQAP